MNFGQREEMLSEAFSLSSVPQDLRFQDLILGLDVKSNAGTRLQIKATKRCFDERADFSAQIASLPFIRNHVFARNDTKSAVFKAFQAVPKAFLEMPKKKTVNLRLKNAILCFGVVSSNNLAVSVAAFSLPTAREILGDEKISIIILLIIH